MFGGRRSSTDLVPQPSSAEAPRIDSASKQMPRGIPGQEKTGELPSAEFADDDHVTGELFYRTSGYRSQIVLGEVADVLIGTRLHKEDRHLLTVAGSRSGKSVSAILPNLIEYQGSVLVTDPKAELASATAIRRAEELGQKVYVLDPFSKSSPAVREKGLNASFNPMTILQLGSSTLVEDADLIADALIIPSGGDAHWDESAKRFLHGVILHVATFSAYKGCADLCTVRDLISRGRTIKQEALTDDQKEYLAAVMPNAGLPGGIDELLIEMLINDAESVDFVIEGCALDLRSKPAKERDSVLSTLRRQTGFLDFPTMRSVLTKNSFDDLSILKTAPRGATIYLCLPAGYMRTCNRWLRLFVSLALQAMERTEEVPAGPGGEPRAPVLFCLDEFPVLGYMPQIEEAAGQLAGFGVRLWPIIQDLTQLKALYKDRWETFIGNAGVLQFFGISDLTTLEYIARLCGKVALSVKAQRQVSAKEKLSGASGQSWSVQSFDLLPVHEARVVFDRDDPYRRQLLLYQGFAPIIASRIRWFEHPFFKDKGPQMMAGVKKS